MTRPHIQKPVFIANWKMNFTSKDINFYFEEFLDEVVSIDGTIGFASPFPFLALCGSYTEQTPFLCGAQNVHWEPEGAFTGEVSASMLVDSGAQFTLIGHSERRTYFADTNQTVAKRAKAAVCNNLIAVVCVGEKREEYESGRTNEVLETQVPESLSLLSGSDFSQLIIAYEPVWAIGTGLSATPEEAEKAHSKIRNILTNILASSQHTFNSELIPILYGGSVKEDNATSLIQQKNIDGFLVGGASLKPESFLSICACQS
jgi:triosephosphate isomerase (TIM)